MPGSEYFDKIASYVRASNMLHSMHDSKLEGGFIKLDMDGKVVVTDHPDSEYGYLDDDDLRDKLDIEELFI